MLYRGNKRRVPVVVWAEKRIGWIKLLAIIKIYKLTEIQKYIWWIFSFKFKYYHQFIELNIQLYVCTLEKTPLVFILYFSLFILILYLIIYKEKKITTKTFNRWHPSFYLNFIPCHIFSSPLNLFIYLFFSSQVFYTCNKVFHYFYYSSVLYWGRI